MTHEAPQALRNGVNSMFWMGVVAHELTHMDDFFDGVPVFHQLLDAVSYRVADIVYGYRSNPLENDARAMQFLINQTYGGSSDLLYPPNMPTALTRSFRVEPHRMCNHIHRRCWG